MEETKFRQFKLKKKLGIGEHSVIYLAEDSLRNSHQVALKLTEISEKEKICKDLYLEAKILTRMRNKAGYPLINDCGFFGNYFYLSLEILGPSLQDFIKFCGGSFSLKTVLQLGCQMVITFSHLTFSIFRSIKGGQDSGTAFGRLHS